MASIFYERAVELIEQIDPFERRMLIQHLQEMQPAVSTQITREILLAEHAARKAAGAFEHEISLFGVYAEPKIEVSETEMQAYLREQRFER